MNDIYYNVCSLDYTNKINSVVNNSLAKRLLNVLWIEWHFYYTYNLCSLFFWLKLLIHNLVTFLPCKSSSCHACHICFSLFIFPFSYHIDYFICGGSHGNIFTYCWPHPQLYLIDFEWILNQVKHEYMKSYNLVLLLSDPTVKVNTVIVWSQYNYKIE